MSDAAENLQSDTVLPLPDTDILAEPDPAGDSLECLLKILSLSQLDVHAAIACESPEEVILDISGTDASLLIGRHGQTLDALQYLLLVIMSTKKVVSPPYRITIDAEGYRQRRIETLTKYALSLAAQVRETGEEAVLEPLNSLERRIVHTALVDDESVETYSEGYGADRHVVISPRQPNSPRRDAD